MDLAEVAAEKIHRSKSEDKRLDHQCGSLEERRAHTARIIAAVYADQSAELERLRKRVNSLEMDAVVRETTIDDLRGDLSAFKEHDGLGDEGLWSMLKQQRDEARTQLSELQQQVEKLRADAERLDFVEQQIRTLGWVKFNRDGDPFLRALLGEHKMPPLRQQIDEWKLADEAESADAARS